MPKEKTEKEEQQSLIPSEAELIKADMDGLKQDIKTMQTNQTAFMEQMSGAIQGLNHTILNSQPAPSNTPAQAFMPSGGGSVSTQNPQPNLTDGMNGLLGLMKGFVEIQTKMKESVYADMKAASEGIFGEAPEEEEPDPLAELAAPLIKGYIEKQSGQQPADSQDAPAPEPPPIPSVGLKDLVKKPEKDNIGTVGGENNAGDNKRSK